MAKEVGVHRKGKKGMDGAGPKDGKTRERKKMGKVAPLGEAAAQIRKGGRALVREVKSLFPEPEAWDTEALREALLEMEEEIGGGNMEGALDRLEEGLAPILAGPGHVSSGSARRFFSLPVFLVCTLGLLLILVWVLSKV